MSHIKYEDASSKDEVVCQEEFSLAEANTNTAEAESSAAAPIKSEIHTEAEHLQDTTEVVSLKTAGMANRYFEPPAFVDEKRSYSQYKEDLRMWSRITSIAKKDQAETAVYALRDHPSCIKEKITVNIGEKIQSAEDGIDTLITFLDTIYKEDEMAEAWTRYKNFQKVVRTGDIQVNYFIADFEKEYMLAKTAGCDYSDTLLAFRLLEATKLNEMDEKFVLTGVDFSAAKTKKDLFAQMKASLKKFQGRTIVSLGDDKTKFDPALVANIAESLIAQGWKQPIPRARKRSNTDPGPAERKPHSTYKGKKNPLGFDRKPLKCFTCGSEYHMKDKCKENKKSDPNNDKNDSSRKIDMGLLAASLQSGNVQEFMKSISSEFEHVMVADTKEHLCLMVVEAGVRGVIDSACSKTVAGIMFIQRYIQKLPRNMKDFVKKGCSSKTIYQFGGGERRNSLMKLPLPCWIGNMELCIETEVVDADIPLLIGANSLEKSEAVIDFGNMKAKFFKTEVTLMKVGSGHFCISLIPKDLNKNEIITQVEETMCSEEIVLHAIASSEELSYKQLQKLHHICGHTTADKLLNLIEKAGKLKDDTKAHLDKIKETCKSCRTNGSLPPRPKFSLPRAECFNKIVTIDLKEYSKSDSKRRYICYLIDMYSRFVAAKFIHNKLPARIIETVMEKWIGVGYGLMKFIHSDIGGELSNKEMQDVASNLNVKLTTTASYSPHQNGINERNHATVDFMLKKMMDSDSTLTPENALFWALNAKNSNGELPWIYSISTCLRSKSGITFYNTLWTTWIRRCVY